MPPPEPPTHANRRAFLAQGAAWLGLSLTGCKPATTAAAPPDEEAASSPARPLVLLEPGTPRYEALRPGFNRRVDRHPAAIVPCRDAADVAGALRLARERGLPVAIRSGGHDFAGLSTNDGGLVVDLSGLAEPTWLDGEHLRVGPGCRLAALVDATLARGRLVPAGSCGGVGVGGLTLGGGYGMFARQFGLTCDSLVALTLVDGTGTVRRVDAGSHPELLWACRGGGNGNFGVVTELAFRTHVAPANLTSHRLRARRLDPSRAARLLELWFQRAAELPRTAFSAFVLNGSTLTILVTDTEAAAPETERALGALRAAVDSVQVGRPEPLRRALPRYEGVREPLAFHNASAGFTRGFADLRAVAEEVARGVARANLVWQINTLGGRIADPDLDRGGAFAHRAFPFLGELQTYDLTPSNAAERLRTFRALLALLRAAGVTRHYRNYPDLELADWDAAYYGDRLALLRQVKRHYDPHDVIRGPQSVRPA